MRPEWSSSVFSATTSSPLTYASSQRGATMAGIRFFNVHRSWEDWVGMLLGVLIGISPLVAEEQHDQAVAWNAILVGALVLGLAQLTYAYVSLQRWEETGLVALGLWLMASPFTFDYAESGTLRYWHFMLGTLVALIAALELWQDRTLRDKELARRGP
jgi:hypothetical protein